MRNQVDILLIARPGRAQKIYDSLMISGLKFCFVSFKLFPIWLKKITKSKKMQVKGTYTINLLLFTLYDYMRFKPHWKWLEKINERRLFEFFLKWIIRNKDFKIIHYWPNYCYKCIADYRRNHPDVVTFAEIYLPCEKYIVDEIAPMLDSLGVGMNVDYIRKRAKLLDDLMSCEDNFICQSEYVVSTYKKYYPNKNYYIIPNDLAISPMYQEKNHITNSAEIKHFVYCGKVSVEKGCDLLVEWFSVNSDYHLHLYGSQDKSEDNVFAKYKSCNNIHFHGTKAKSELQKEFFNYDIGIHLSRYESFSNAVCEILGSGLPVIVSDQTGNSEQVMQYDFGEVCQLTMESITLCVNKIIAPRRYNLCIDNIDKYIRNRPKSYGDRVVDFYMKYIEPK